MDKIDVGAQLSAGWATIAQQAVMNNGQIAHFTGYAFQKDLFQGGQGESPALNGALNALAKAPYPVKDN